MAQAFRFVCSHCEHQVVAWSDGNPFVINNQGEKEHVHHPQLPPLDQIAGNDNPHLCLQCGERFLVDSREPTATCPACSAAEIAATCDLDGKPCPFCKAGRFVADAKPWAIS